MAFIRPYEKRDFEATAHICRATLPPSLESSPAARVLAPYLWTHQYTHLSPSTCFVLDDGTGTAVGYCIGCPDTRAFAAAYPSYTSSVLDASDEVRQHLRGSDPPRMGPTSEPEPWTLSDGTVNGACLVQMAYDPQRLLAVQAAVAARFPAMLHIDLLGKWQGRGWGARLLERTVRALEEEGQGSAEASVEGGGGGGVWVGVAADNAKVVPFYEKMGFRLWRDDDDDSEGEKREEEEEEEHISSSNDWQRGGEESSEAGPGDGGSIVLVREFLGGAGLRPGKAGGVL